MGITAKSPVLPKPMKAKAAVQAPLSKPYFGTLFGTDVNFDSYEDAIRGDYRDIGPVTIFDNGDDSISITYTNVYVHLDTESGQLMASFQQGQTHFLIDAGDPHAYERLTFHWNPMHRPGDIDWAYTVTFTRHRNWGLANDYYANAKFYVYWNGQRYDFPFAHFRTHDEIERQDKDKYKKDAQDFDDAKQNQLVDLQAARDAANGKIDNNDGLTDDQKRDIHNKIEQAYEDGVDKMTDDTKQSDIDNDGAAAKKKIEDLGNTKGVDVPAKKQQIKADFESEAKKVIAKINADNGLTSAEKKTQIDAVNNDVTTYSKKIDNDRKLDIINADEAAGMKAIDAEYHAGDLDKVKAANKAKIDALAAKLLAKINQDSTLTTDQKTAQSNKVKADQAKFDQEIDQAANADDANSLGDSDFSSDYQTGDSLDKQKAAAKAKIAAEAKDLIDRINADKTLPQSVRQTQIDTVNSDAKTADDYIDAANDADAINSATTNGKNTMDGAYKPGDPLPTQKQHAKDAIQDALTKLIAKINADKTLTRAEKDAEIAKAKADAATIDTNIDNAPDADTINQTRDNGVKTINGDYHAGKSIDQQKAEAKDKVDAEAARIIDAINADRTLTAAQRSQQIAQVNRDKAAADQAIANADNADDINSARDTGMHTIDSDYQPGASLADQRAAAKRAIDDAAQAAIDAINNDATLSSDQKTAQINQVKAAKDAAYNAIDQAGDADGINAARDNGVNTINGIHKPGTPVDDRKKSAKQSLEDEARRVIAAIKADDTLTTYQKNQQIDAVNRDLATAEQNIDNATAADAINSAFNTGKEKIDGDHVPGESLDQQKKDAKDKIDKEAALVIDKINKDPTISGADKAAQIAAVNADKTKAENSIDAASNVDGVNNALTAGISAIDGDYTPGQPLGNQKNEAKAKVDAEAQKIINDINNDNTLSAADKAAQIAKVKDDEQKADNAIDQATDHDGIQTAMQNGISAIDKDHVPGQSLDAQKTAAKAALDAEAKKIINAINADNTLTEKQKADQIAWVKHDEESYDNTIDSDGSADAIQRDLKAGIKEIDSEHIPGASLDDQKNNAKKAIDDAAKQALDGNAKAAIAGINNDPTLPAAEKQKQIDKVNADKRKALIDINNAKDADGINDATNKGKAAIDGDYVPGASLADQKKAAKANVDGEAAKIIAKIKADNTLSAAQKAAQIAAVQHDQQVADNAIDAATNADGIDTAETTGIHNIDGDYVPGASLDNQKKDAKANLEKEAKKIIDDIQNDATLTGAEKAAQIAQVNRDKTNAEDAIDGAQNADQIASDFTSGKNAIDGDHKPGTPLDNHKAELKKSLDAEAKKVIDEINADNSLSNAQKQAQIAQVNTDKENAENAIDAATNTDDMNDAFDAGKRAIDGDYVPGKPLPDQKKDQKANLESEAQRIIDAINADNTLTQTEKNTQIAQVKADLATAEGKIDAANSQDDVMTAFNNGKNTIDGDHKPGLSLDQQKKNAKAAIDQRAKDLINQINGDNTLTNAEKASQVNKVQNDQAAADSNIDEASNADGVNQARDAGLSTLNGDYHAGLSLDQQKQNAKSAVDAEAQRVIDQINADNTLTQAQKTAQINQVKADAAAADAAIDKAADKAKADIDNAGNAEDAKKAADAGKSNIDGLNDAKNNAYDKINEIADAAKKAIDGNKNYTDEEKAARKDGVDQAANNWKDEIDHATSVDEVNDILNKPDYDRGMKDAVSGGEVELDDQKNDHKKDIDDAASKAKDGVDANDKLSDDEKSKQKDAIDGAADKAKSDIDKADNAEDAKKAADAGKDNIDGLNDAKNKAHDAIDGAADKAKAGVDANDKLNADEKSKQKDAIDEAAKKAKSDIDGQTTVDDVKKAEEAGKNNIDGLNDAKNAAHAKVDAAADAAKAAIDNNANLSDDEKSERKKAVDEAAKDIKDLVDQETTVDDVKKAVENVDFSDIVNAPAKPVDNTDNQGNNGDQNNNGNQGNDGNQNNNGGNVLPATNGNTNNGGNTNVLPTTAGGVNNGASNNGNDVLPTTAGGNDTASSNTENDDAQLPTTGSGKNTDGDFTKKRTQKNKKNDHHVLTWSLLALILAAVAGYATRKFTRKNK